MLKKYLLALVLGVMTSFGFAVEINTASQAELDGIKGIGPKLSKSILEQREKATFKDWTDLSARVSGIKAKKAAQLSKAGLTVAGQSLDAGTPAAPAASVAPAKTDNKPKALDKPAASGSVNSK